MSGKEIINYRPGGLYWREAWREAESLGERQALYFALLRDHELLRDFCRANGLVPPKFELTAAEVADKPWLLTLLPGAQMELSLPEPGPDHQGELLLFPSGGVGE